MNALRIHCHNGPEIPDLPLVDRLPTPENMAPASECADARIFLAGDGGRVAAYAALWWNDTPVYQGWRVGAIGGFAALDEAAGHALLEQAARRLREAGCRITVGPMNGNTWRRHRYVTSGDDRGPFLFEPRNPAEYPAWWRSAGFRDISHYSSSVIRLDGRRAVSPAMRRRLGNSGVMIRGLDASRYEEELKLIHALSLKSFSANFLYTALDEVEFLQAYGKVRQHVDPDFVKVAERGGVPCGFVFAIRDLEAEARGEKPAVIVKTLAVDPQSRSAGLGSLLVDEVHAAALDKGYEESIHALEHESNTSRKITSRYDGRVFRNYTLFAKPL